MADVMDVTKLGNATGIIKENSWLVCKSCEGFLLICAYFYNYPIAVKA